MEKVAAQPTDEAISEIFSCKIYLFQSIYKYYLGAKNFTMFYTFFHYVGENFS